MPLGFLAMLKGTAVADEPASSNDAKTVTLAVDGLSSDEHTYAKGHDPITREGTEVPASKAKKIIDDAADQGVQIREVK